jgi:transcriptional regulator with XRE-family HTH domain
MMCIIWGMTLDEYLAAEKPNGLTEAVFAARIGSSQPHVNRLRRGANPGFSLMERIKKATGGAVTPNDFLPPDEAA